MQGILYLARRQRASAALRLRHAPCIWARQPRSMRFFICGRLTRCAIITSLGNLPILCPPRPAGAGTPAVWRGRRAKILSPECTFYETQYETPCPRRADRRHLCSPVPCAAAACLRPGAVPRKRGAYAASHLHAGCRLGCDDGLLFVKPVQHEPVGHAVRHAGYPDGCTGHAQAAPCAHKGPAPCCRRAACPYQCRGGWP